MYIKVTESIFINSFLAIRPNNFSYAGLKALYEYFTCHYESIELDVIGICCDFAQYTEEEALEAYDVESMYELGQKTTVIECSDSTVIVWSI